MTAADSLTTGFPGFDSKKIAIERALEPTKKFGFRVKPPKTARGLRTISLDDATIAMLLREKPRYQQVTAGVPYGTDVNLSLG